VEINTLLFVNVEEAFKTGMARRDKYHGIVYIQIRDTMLPMERYFEWDEQKAENNFRKHGIRFVDAARVFDDPLAVTDQDRIENGEQRWQTVGIAEGHLLLLVAHSVRFEDEGIEVVRIISARRVDRAERRRYEHG
jgi:uncharacterized DUF497 family protein